MTITGENKLDQKLLQRYLGLILFEGLFAFLLIFGIPSQEENAFFLGYSPFRWLLGILFALLLGVYLVIFIISRVNSSWFDTTIQRIDLFLDKNDHLLAALAFLAAGIITFVLALLFFQSPLSTNAPVMKAIWQRSLSISAWFALVCVQSLALLFYTYQKSIKKAGFWKPGIIFQIALILVIILVSFFYWMVLIFQEALFVAMDGWFWQFQARPFTPRDLIFLILAGITLLATHIILQGHRKIRISLVMLVLLAFISQFGFGLMEGLGFESLRQKFTTSFHRGFAEHAVDNPDVFLSMTEYETLYGQDINLGTKPPGALLVYLVLHKFTQFFYPAGNFAERFLHLTQVSAILFPFLASLAVIPLYYLGKDMLTGKYALVACLYFVISTNFVLMPLAMDQFLLPLLSLGILLFTLQAIRTGSVGWAFSTGVFLYISIFFSFSLLPLAGLVLAWIVLDSFILQKQADWIHTIKMICAVFAGVVILMMLFRIVLNYDIILRYTTAFARHRAHKSFDTDMSGIFTSLWINNVEFLFWTGVPILVLAMAGVVKSIRSFFNKSANRLDGLVLAFVPTYLALNFLGQTRSEVGRLWLYLVPLACLIAVRQARSIFSRPPAGVYSVVVLQLISTFLTYKFQDFYF